MPQKYYAIRNGRRTGLRDNWPETEELVSGFPNADFKCFTNKRDAEDYLAAPSPRELERLMQDPVFRNFWLTPSE